MRKMNLNDDDDDDDDDDDYHCVKSRSEFEECFSAFLFGFLCVTFSSETYFIYIYILIFFEFMGCVVQLPIFSLLESHDDQRF